MMCSSFAKVLWYAMQRVVPKAMTTTLMSTTCNSTLPFVFMVTVQLGSSECDAERSVDLLVDSDRVDIDFQVLRMVSRSSGVFQRTILSEERLKLKVSLGVVPCKEGCQAKVLSAQLLSFSVKVSSGSASFEIP